MKFGKTAEQRAAAHKAFYKHWHEHFAWRPRKLNDDGRYAWLETVMRKVDYEGDLAPLYRSLEDHARRKMLGERDDAEPDVAAQAGSFKPGPIMYRDPPVFTRDPTLDWMMKTAETTDDRYGV